ncbi:Uma2 family endonuclease, partial [bacterium]|nr:Uma2 family endonuclease [bacterium]
NENGQWVLEEFTNLEAVLKIQTPGVEIKIAEFYEKVEFV